MQDYPIPNVYRLYFESVKHAFGKPLVVLPYGRKFIIAEVTPPRGRLDITAVIEREAVCEFLTKRHLDIEMEYRARDVAEEAARDAHRAASSKPARDADLEAAIADIDLSDLEF